MKIIVITIIIITIIIIKIINSFFQPGDFSAGSTTESKKVPCYTRDSTCRWCIVENTKIF